MRRFSVLLLSVLLIPAIATAQNANDLYLHALDDWHDGHYPDALEAFQQILGGSEAEGYFEKIALQTGELYKVTELSVDGTNIRFDASGKYAIYERAEDGEMLTHIYDVSTGEQAGTFSGTGLMILADGSVVFRKLADTDEVKSITETRQLALDALIAGIGSRDAYFTAQREYLDVIRTNNRLWYSAGVAQPAKDITPGNVIIGESISTVAGLFVTALEKGAKYSDIYSLDPKSGSMKNLTNSRNFEGGIEITGNGNLILFTFANQNSLDSESEVKPETSGMVGVLDVKSGNVTELEGEVVAVGTSGSGILVTREDGDNTVLVSIDATNGFEEHEIISSEFDLRYATVSPGDSKVAYSIKEQDDYEVYVHDIDGNNRIRVTRELQHDIYPTFLTDTKLIAAKGEGRHRRSFIYDLETGAETKLFHNNTVRTIAPEYQWAVNASGDKILIVAERDGDTISPERGVYLLDLSTKISKAELEARIESQLAGELALREKGERLYKNIADEVKAVVAEASRNRVYTYENDLYKFDSKYISQPGNDKAGEYLFNTYTSFGYSPEYQWFSPAGREVFGGKTANVLATLPGTTNPELVYVVSSHYDSVERGPGADDNTSGTAALLEAARILADHPMPCTIIFASFTGEEAGLLGSREFVRQAQENGMQIVGALNNDMVGMANNSRLDNTIRYSNAGIRDIQHAAAFLFTDMVTYDALYYKSTDAHAYYEAYGDIVGGIGSYPVLGNPFYHQWNDNLETINHQLVTEVAKTTAATLMLLASSPSRIKGLEISTNGNTVNATWIASPEKGITKYLVQYTNTSGEVETVEVNTTKASLSNVASESTVKVKAVNEKGFEGWDWAKAEVK